jgi:cation:H+ antiporter
MILYISMLIVGIFLLLLGGHFLVAGAVKLGKIFKVPDVIMGLTVISMATSAPELLVSIQSALVGSPALALGNVIGSNIANILLILGITACIRPLVIRKIVIIRDIPLVFVASLLVIIFLNDQIMNQVSLNVLSRTESFVLLLGFIIFSYMLYRAGKKDLHTHPEKISISKKHLFFSVGIVFVGVGLLVFGAKLTISHAVSLARVLKISERIIGLTLIAVGTSLPELVASIVAVIHKKTDMVVGNLIGSNIFNIFFILGITGMISPIGADTLPWVDSIFLILSVVWLFVHIFLGKKYYLGRLQGIFLLFLYFVYLYLII